MKLFVDLGIAFFALCGGTSILAGALHHILTPWLARLSPAWRARLRTVLLYAPITVAALGVGIALLPSVLELMSLASDHCLSAAGHGHSHLCFVHQATGASRMLASIVLAFGTVILARVAFLLHRSWRAYRVFASVISTSPGHFIGHRQYLFESEVPVCITLGLSRPRIYISSAAVAALGEEYVHAALAHEQGHLVRHETRARFLGSIAAAFHVRSIGQSLLKQWNLDSEFICDEFAARSVGSAGLVAEALVRFRRAWTRVGATPIRGGACLCAEGSHLKARVVTLLAMDVGTQADSQWVGMPACILGTLTLLLGLSLQARHLHHVLESFVAFVGSAFV